MDGLNANFSSNIGPDNTQVYSGSLLSQSDATSVFFNFSPFLYNPGAGNLLLNVSASGVTTRVSAFLANDGDANGVYSRMTDFTGVGSSGYGLQTAFTYFPAAPTVPEPATWLTMILGFGLVGFALRQRRERTTVLFA